VRQALSSAYLHLGVILGVTVVGFVFGDLTGLSGSIAYFLPIVLLAAAAGITVRRYLPGFAPFAAWIMLPTLVIFIWAIGDVDISAWRDGLEMRFIGLDGFCGDLICGGQVYATAPLIASIAYALALSVGRPVATWQDVVRDATVVGAALFAVSWLGMSLATQSPSVILHLSCGRGHGILAPADAWCRTSAAPEYLALSLPAKLSRATGFYDSTMAPQLKRAYFEADDYRRSFLTASLESEIDRTGSPPSDFAYRRFYDHGYPRREIRRLTRDAGMIALAGAVVILVARWVYRRRRIA
jgi:hypothetical protein